MTNRRRNTHERRARLLQAERMTRRVMPFSMAALSIVTLTENLGDGNYRTLPIPTEE